MSDSARLAWSRPRLAVLASSHGRRGVVFLAHFGAAKALAYFGPLALAALLPPLLYGAIEMALSIALLIALAASLGLSAAAPRLMLRGNPSPVVDLLAAHVAIAGLLLLVLGALSWAAGRTLVTLALALTVVTLAASALSALARSRSLRDRAVWADGLAPIAATALGVTLFSLGQLRPEAMAVAAAMMAGVIVAAAAALAKISRKPDFTSRYRRAVALGLPMLAYAGLAVWMAVGGRILIGAASGAADVALYAFEFRVASMLLIVHSVLSVGLFARVYKMRTRLFDRLGALYLLFVGFVGLVLCAWFARFEQWIPTQAMAGDNVAVARAIFPLVVVHAFGWNASALLESRINRFGLAGRATVASALIVVVSLLAARTLSGPRLEGLCVLLALQWMAHNAAQLAVLASRGLWMPRVAGSIALGYAGIWLVKALD